MIEVLFEVETLKLAPLGRSRAVGYKGQAYAMASESPKGFDRPREQLGSLFPLSPVRQTQVVGQVVGQVGKIEPQPAKRPIVNRQGL